VIGVAVPVSSFRGIIAGCIGLLSTHGAVAVEQSYLQAAGMLFELCDKVKLLPKTDSIAAKRVVLKVRIRLRIVVCSMSMANTRFDCCMC
jgi:hypothetical protein